MVERSNRTFIGAVPPPSSKVAGVYRYHNVDTGETYIGSTVNGYGRFIQHTSALARGDHVNKRFQRAYNESPYFEVEFIPIPPDREHEEPLKVVREIEQHLIDTFPDRRKLLNIARDARACGGGISPSEETRAKISASLKGRIVTEETRKRQSDALLGHRHSDETKEKLRQAKLGKKQSPSHAKKSKQVAMIRARPVLVSGVVYESIKAAADAHGINPNSAKKRINSIKNFDDWKYAEKPSVL